MDTRKAHLARRKPAAQPLEDRSGHISGAGGRDKAASSGKGLRQDLYEEIRAQFERLQVEMNRTMAHEMRVPLTSIKGFASTLLQPDVTWSEEEKKDFLEAIQRESDRLNYLISDMVHISCSESNVPRVQKCSCRVPDMLSSVRNTLLLLAKRHQLQVLVPRNLPPVWADPGRIAQVLIILVENATRHSPEGSAVSVEARADAAGVVLTVSDRGSGMPQSKLDVLFDDYLHQERAAAGRKAGRLGLPLCRTLVEAHGGRIWAESKLGEGSKLKFSIPSYSTSLESKNVSQTDTCR